MVEALVQGNTGAQHEHLQRDDEAPEVELAAIAERVAFVGGQHRAVNAIEQHALVAGVDQRMHRLAQHRGASGPPGGGKLDERDQEIAGQGGIDHALGRGGCTHEPAARRQEFLFNAANLSGFGRGRSMGPGDPLEQDPAPTMSVQCLHN